MANDPVLSDTETVGRFLQRHRTEKGVDLAQVSEETRIPSTTLQAMEDGDYKALPADAFARGFYSIYARFLELDVEYVLEHYAEERRSSQKYGKKILLTPSKKGEAVSPMAERPMVSPISLMGFTLVLLILLVTGICWYFSWNPANYLSERLRSFGKKPVVEQTKRNSIPGPAPASVKEKIVLPAPATTAAENPAAAAAAATWKYALLAEFQESTKITVVVDDDFPEEMNFTQGQQHEWHAKKSMTLTLPADTKTRLTLNGVIIPLPAPVDGFITVSVPGTVSK